MIMMRSQSIDIIVLDMKHFHNYYTLFWKILSLQHVIRRCANIKSEYRVVMEIGEDCLGICTSTRTSEEKTVAIPKVFTMASMMPNIISQVHL